VIDCTTKRRYTAKKVAVKEPSGFLKQCELSDWWLLKKVLAP
jgi:hypothetical protein